MRKKDFCTKVPDKIFGIYIGDICKDHDRDYLIGGNVFNKLKADWRFFIKIFKRKKRLIPVSIIYYFGVSLVGWRYFSWD